MNKKRVQVVGIILYKLNWLYTQDNIFVIL
jgi:hypothetical protein